MKNVHKDCKYYHEERDVCLNYAMGKYHGLTYDISKKDKCISELIKPNKLSACPSNMVAFLMHKGLINEKLLFSQRMELEKEFYEWCENGGKETAKDKC